MRFFSIRGASVKCVIATLLAVAMLAISTPATFAAGGVYGTLAGTVVDTNSNQPISNASVTAKSPNNTYNATTDAGGHFTILGVAVDTYTVTVTAPGHDTVNIPGVNVFGDQINTVQTVGLQPHLATIARVTSRSVSSAYQPTQTTDSYTINQQQMIQSTGKAMSTNENSALLSVPGVTLTNSAGMNGSGTTQVTIRGAAATEIGYQLDGVPFREEFFHQNASFGLMNGVGSIQVVEGPGDATQAGVGAGVINVVPARGAGPGSGTLDLGIGSPNFSHEAGISYGFSTPDNRLSEYVSYIGQRYVPYNGYSFTNLPAYGNYFAQQYATNDQILNNLFFKFGKDLSQQFQVLYMNVNQEGYAGVTGPGGLYDPAANPGALVYYPYDQLVEGTVIGVTGATGTPYTPTQFAQLVGLSPGVPANNVAITSPQQQFSNSTRFLKLEYDNALSATTYMSLRYYNWGDLQATDGSYSQGPWFTGFPGIGQIWNGIGGNTSGVNFDLLHQFGSKLTVTLNGQYNVVRPLWTDYSPGLTFLAPLISGLSTGGGAAPAFTPQDWLPGGYVYNYFATTAVAVPSQDCSTMSLPAGFASNCLPRIPTWGINYNGTEFQEWGAGLRFQYNPTDRLRFDLGYRQEGQNQHWYSQIGNLGQGAPATGFACNGTCGGALTGAVTPILSPFDVANNFWTNNVLHPTVAEPRAAVSYQLGANDSLRFSYGRTGVFADAQTAGTPFVMTGIEPYLKIPAQAGAVCGWVSTTIFPCQSYAAQLYWAGDNVEAPDAGNGLPAIYSNYDLSYNHLFRSGWGMKLTPFFKEGTQLPASFLINPVLGIFAVGNQGFNKTTGVEFDLTTPQRAVGFSGFFAATYQNVLSTTPPFTSAENLVPLVSLASLQLGDLYRAGYVSPFSIRIGGIENFKSGFSISPQLQFNVGYPYTVGNTIAGTLANGTNANVPQVDFGSGITGGNASLIGPSPGAAISTNYYDPAYPGSALNPNIAATRGISATAANGGYLSHWNLQGNVTFQYKWSKNTLGLQLFNIFGNAFVNSVPAVNPYYQPVATGLSGPGTNVNSCVQQTGPGIRGCVPQIPGDVNAFTNGAYLLTNGNFTGTPFLGPQQPFALQLYYQRAF